MGDNVDSDLLYDDFQNEEQKEFNVRKFFYFYIFGEFTENSWRLLFKILKTPIKPPIYP